MTIGENERKGKKMDRMDREKRDAAYCRFITEYGADVQMNQAVEELSELIKALMKWKRPHVSQAYARADIIDEIADVRIMCRQMELLFEAEPGEVEDRIDYKIERQLKRIGDAGTEKEAEGDSE